MGFIFTLTTSLKLSHQLRLAICNRWFHTRVIPTDIVIDGLIAHGKHY